MSAPAGALFPPEDPERAAVLEVLHPSPTQFGHGVTRWTLALLVTTCLPLAGLSLSGAWRRLDKWGLARKRSRDYVHSPDPAYAEKVAAIQAALTQARTAPATHILLYADECTDYRQPAPGYAYGERGSGGRHQPRARMACASTTKCRVVGALDAVTGQVHWASDSTMGIDGLRAFLHQLRTAYGPERTLTLVWDNWPVHDHAQVVTAAAAAQVAILHTPTYAPWTNPIEQLWNWLKADVLRLHPWAEVWETVQRKVADFLDQFSSGARALLRSVGLAEDEEPDKPQGASP